MLPGLNEVPVHVPEGYIQDYISGRPVKATPEEVEAVQVFARRLVEDFGYPKDHIQTRPQFRVRRRPSDEKRSYPIDIAVFSSPAKIESDLYMIVECKKKRRRDGIAQLKIYMDMSPAKVGVWFNGQEHVYLRKFVHPDGRVTYPELPNIPRFGERVEDIGLYVRGSLAKPSNIKAIFRDIRNYLAGNAVGITRDESLAQEIINLLFCKIYDETHTASDMMVTFRSGVDEPLENVAARITGLFGKMVEEEYSDVFDEDDAIHLDPASINYVVGELQTYCLTDADRDAIADAFEVFIGPALRGTEGQFFTPRNVIRMMVDILDPQPGELILDPACGSGGFLIAALDYVWRIIDEQAQEMGWTPVQLDRRKREIASRFFRGVDKDRFLAKVTKAYMAIVGDGRGGVFCENSLLLPEKWHPVTRDKIELGKFDVVMTNPPFGTKIPIKGQETLSQYDLGHRWKRDRETGRFEQSNRLYDTRPPQLLFLERCLQLLKPGGRMGIVLPESMFGMPTYEYVVNWLRNRAKVVGVVSMPEDLFQPHTHAKTAILFIQNVPPSDDHEIFMSVVRWCGHDSRGNPTIRNLPDGSQVLLDDVPLVASEFRELIGRRWYEQ